MMYRLGLQAQSSGSSPGHTGAWLGREQGPSALSAPPPSKPPYFRAWGKDGQRTPPPGCACTALQLEEDDFTPAESRIQQHGYLHKYSRGPGSGAWKGRRASGLVGLLGPPSPTSRQPAQTAVCLWGCFSGCKRSQLSLPAVCKPSCRGAPIGRVPGTRPLLRGPPWPDP